MALDIEPAWLIECWRCANDDTSDAVGSTAALAYFEAMGWKKTDDGYQMCPLCWGSHLNCLAVGALGARP